MKQRAWLRRLARRVRLAIRRDPATLLAAAHQDGDTIQLAVGPKRLVILNHPASVEQVLRVRHKRFTKGRAHIRAQRWLGNGILVSEGDEHHRQRRLLMRALQPQHVAACGAVIVRQATALGDTWHGPARRSSLRTVSSCAWFAANRTQHRKIRHADSTGIAVAR